MGDAEKNSGIDGKNEIVRFRFLLIRITIQLSQSTFLIGQIELFQKSELFISVA